MCFGKVLKIYIIWDHPGCQKNPQFWVRDSLVIYWAYSASGTKLSTRDIDMNERNAARASGVCRQEFQQGAIKSAFRALSPRREWRPELEILVLIPLVPGLQQNSYLHFLILYLSLRYQRYLPYIRTHSLRTHSMHTESLFKIQMVYD